MNLQHFGSDLADIRILNLIGSNPEIWTRSPVDVRRLGGGLRSLYAHSLVL